MYVCRINFYQNGRITKWKGFSDTMDSSKIGCIRSYGMGTALQRIPLIHRTIYPVILLIAIGISKDAHHAFEKRCLSNFRLFRIIKIPLMCSVTFRCIQNQLKGAQSCLKS